MSAHFIPSTISLGLHPTSRKLVEKEIERLIELLDTVDGDCDLEDDDPAGDPIEMHGEEPTACGKELLPTLPIYGDDQSLGPINEREALIARNRALFGEARRRG